MILRKEGQRLVLKNGEETLWIEGWGENSLRVRMTKEHTMDPRDWALSELPKETSSVILIEEVPIVEPWYRGEEKEKHTRWLTQASITNGTITAKINVEGWISFENEKGEVLLEEYWRNRNRIDRYCVPTGVSARELKPRLGSTDYGLRLRFEAYDEEHIFGMGQYQDDKLDRKGCKLSLSQRNSQSSVPFMISSRGYGFLWNNPAIGEVTFGRNITEWTAESTKKLDYFITVGDTPEHIMKQYTDVVGRAPMMPEYGMGFWQCKLRYRNQEEVLRVARGYHTRGIKLDVIVVDFFHWPKQGEFRFDPVDWPDPEAMIQELNSYGIELMVSVWPTIDTSSSNYGRMNQEGYLVGADRGLRIHMNWMGEVVFYDATNPGARALVWEECKKNYFDKGVKLFWLDEAEPEFGPYDFDIYRYYEGPALQVSNMYPVAYAKGFYDGMKEAGMENPLNLVRCAWAGSQKYGALIWSGDVHSSFRALREQLQAGLNMGLAGIPWWTTDIGGFLGGDIHDKEFHELLVRWFEWGTYCPVMRLHGERPPFYELEEEYRNGTKLFSSGQENEIWSFGEENYAILKGYIERREQLRPYLRNCMKEAHETGAPVMRTMYYQFPSDQECLLLQDQYMLGSTLLVAPVMEAKVRRRSVYLPKETRWKQLGSDLIYDGGQWMEVEAPLEVIPVFELIV